MPIPKKKQLRGDSIGGRGASASSGGNRLPKVEPKTKFEKLNKIDAASRKLLQSLDNSNLTAIEKGQIRRKMDSLSNAWYKEFDKIKKIK